MQAEPCLEKGKYYISILQARTFSDNQYLWYSIVCYHWLARTVLCMHSIFVSLSSFVLGLQD